MAKSVEDLLRPRYRVNDKGFPDMIFTPGEILQLKVLQNGEVWLHYEYQKPMSETKTVNFDESYFKRYPHLFQKLEWWQDREISEMPEYVKHKVSGEVVGFGHQGIVVISDVITTVGWLTLYDCLPATKEDYNNYLKNKSL